MRWQQQVMSGRIVARCVAALGTGHHPAGIQHRLVEVADDVLVDDAVRRLLVAAGLPAVFIHAFQVVVRPREGEDDGAICQLLPLQLSHVGGRANRSERRVGETVTTVHN